MATSDLARRFLNTHRDAILADWFELLRIPSLGGNPKDLRACAQCAAWLKKRLRPMGFDCEVCLTSGQPVLLAERLGKPGAPTVLFYGHYDVQPADPLEAWQTPPFEPELRNGRVYARGASDNKGQLFAFLQGLAALIDANLPLPTLRLVLEGEEECGSPGLLENLNAWRRRLQADIMLVCDTSVHPSGRPAIVAGLRGIGHLTVSLRGPANDLHSGIHGGLCPNPAAGLSRLIASLHDDQGRIAVAGFLDRVTPPTAKERELARSVPFDPAAYERATGAPPFGGESGIPPEERVGFHPSIDVNGIHSGYGGPGSKTVLPATALAKLSVRYCAQQSPQECMNLIVEHLRQHCPAGMTLDFPEVCAGTPALRLPIHTPVVRLAEDVLRTIDPRGPVFLWEGASIPVIGALRDISGASPLLVGFGREEDAIHAPNESFGMDQFELDMILASLLLNAIAGNPG